eukprot:CAMPEP_0202690404 /NCGR_PEP_ID=MMETSP1385-20130828/5396_1 /ASSEMBLY_ACC=CAM_ASM_000861 /TAXON_ID=933848 /ORGANISM="Elphidium margaritaceum" /LENGTH=453 /DNA_ID=CAMNT_0049345665 /DNA_START=83 /DNA_END=1444 /DNA_ORIENTATION=-
MTALSTTQKVKQFKQLFNQNSADRNSKGRHKSNSSLVALKKRGLVNGACTKLKQPKQQQQASKNVRKPAPPRVLPPIAPISIIDVAPMNPMMTAVLRNNVFMAPRSLPAWLEIDDIDGEREAAATIDCVQHSFPKLQTHASDQHDDDSGADDVLEICATFSVSPSIGNCTPQNTTNALSPELLLAQSMTSPLNTRKPFAYASNVNATDAEGQNQCSESGNGSGSGCIQLTIDTKQLPVDEEEEMKDECQCDHDIDVNDSCDESVLESSDTDDDIDGDSGSPQSVSKSIGRFIITEVPKKDPDAAATASKPSSKKKSTRPLQWKPVSNARGAYKRGRTESLVLLQEKKLVKGGLLNRFGGGIESKQSVKTRKVKKKSKQSVAGRNLDEEQNLDDDDDIDDENIDDERPLPAWLAFPDKLTQILNTVPSCQEEEEEEENEQRPTHYKSQATDVLD